jgi:hypothetical protein
MHIPFLDSLARKFKRYRIIQFLCKPAKPKHGVNIFTLDLANLVNSKVGKFLPGDTSIEALATWHNESWNAFYHQHLNEKQGKEVHKLLSRICKYASIQTLDALRSSSQEKLASERGITEVTAAWLLMAFAQNSG